MNTLLRSMTSPSASAASAGLVVAVLVAATAAPARAQSAGTTINLSSLETVLAEPNNMDAKMLALWAGFFTQVYEYSMPFVELSVGPNDLAVTQARITIGDTDFRFDDEFHNIEHTNSMATEQPGGYARLGQSSTAGVGFTSSIEAGGDALLIDFGPGGLQPGETVRLQVDLAADDPSGSMFPSYTSVLFDANANPADTSDNSVITLTLADGSTQAVTLPDFDVDLSSLPDFGNPRAYSVMQTIDPLDPQGFNEVIPEPTTAALAALAACGLAARRRR